MRSIFLHNLQSWNKNRWYNLNQRKDANTCGKCGEVRWKANLRKNVKNAGEERTAEISHHPPLCPFGRVTRMQGTSEGDGTPPPTGALSVDHRPLWQGVFLGGGQPPWVAQGGQTQGEKREEPRPSLPADLTGPLWLVQFATQRSPHPNQRSHR